jgi:hypothetical protein
MALECGRARAASGSFRQAQEAGVHSRSYVSCERSAERASMCAPRRLSHLGLDFAGALKPKPPPELTRTVNIRFLDAMLWHKDMVPTLKQCTEHNDRACMSCGCEACGRQDCNSHPRMLACTHALHARLPCWPTVVAVWCGPHMSLAVRALRYGAGLLRRQVAFH